VLRLSRLAVLLFFLPPWAFGQVAPVPQQQAAQEQAAQPQAEDADDDSDDEVRPTPPPIAVATPRSTIPPVNRIASPRAPAPTASVPAGAPDMVRLQFPNSDVDDVLRLYEQLTGKKLVRDNFVQGKVNIFISKEVPREEAIKIIQINLLMNGFSLVPADEDIIKVIGTGKNPRTTGVPIISDPSQIPEADQVVSFLFKLRYADPQELQQVLGQYLSPPQTYTSFLALPKSSSLLITENSSVIRTISKIIDQVDIPPAEVVSEFIPLLRADASKVVDMLKDVFEKGTQPSQAGVVPGQPLPPGVRNVRPGMPVPQPVNNDNDVGALTALTEDSVVVGKIKLAADIRTNRIHVITRPINMPFVRKLIAEFDANVEFAKPVTRALRYISAGDVLPVLVQSLTEPGTQQQGGADQTGANAANPNQQNRNRTNSPNSPNQSSSSSSTSSDTGSNLNISEELSTNAVDTTPKAVTVGNAKIIADQRANTIIVLGNREVVVKVQKILDEMDVKAPQVALSTVIGELTLSNDEEFGVDWFGKYKNKVVGISRNTGAPIPSASAAASPSGSPVITPGILDPSGLVNFGNALQQVTNGTNVYVAAGNYLSAIVHLLESTGRFKTVSRPTVFTSNNKKAIIASGQEIPVPVSTLSSIVNNTGVTGSNIGQQSNIQFKKVALQLEVVPLINSEKEVSLDILQKIDSLGTSTVIDGNSIPTINTRYIRTNVAAPNGCTIVLGGLIQDSKGKNTSGIPILDKLPWVGSLFRTTTGSKMRTELIILMRPEVTLTKLDLYRLRQKNEEHTHFGPEIDQGDCPDCPTQATEDKQLPPPDLPAAKDL
jgi:general secretion pathway protein D